MLLRRKSDLQYDPKIYFIDSQGKYRDEYFPPENTWLNRWLKDKYLLLRVKLGKDIYYWHVRHKFQPSYRKIDDIEFINHVMHDHDQNPTDRLEKRHYKWAWHLYGDEMNFVASQIGMDSESVWKSKKNAKGHPYAYAYTERWFKTYKDPETKMIFHGLSWDEYQAYEKLVRDRAQQMVIDYSKKHGLDPETGEKLPKQRTGKKKKR